MSLTNADRTVDFGIGTKKTDRGEKGWFRFEGSAGTKMRDSCPKYSYNYIPKRLRYQPRPDTCNTNAPGWMTGSEPTVNEGQVTRTACFSWNSNCCFWSTSITVRNCGSYLVYHLTSTPDGGSHSLRYCGNGWLSSSKQKLSASFHLFQIIVIIIIAITLTLIIAVYLRHKFSSSTSWNKKF